MQEASDKIIDVWSVTGETDNYQMSADEIEDVREYIGASLLMNPSKSLTISHERMPQSEYDAMPEWDGAHQLEDYDEEMESDL